MSAEIPSYVYVVFLVFTAATAVGVLIQAAVLLGMFFGLSRLQAKIETILTHMTEHALPLIASTKVAMNELSPKVKIIADNLVEVSETLKQESKTIKVSVDDVLNKTRAQTARVDEMVSGTLDGISHAGAAIQHGIEVPLRQIQGVLNGLKAGFGVLRRKAEPVSDPPAAEPEISEVIVLIEESADRNFGGFR